MPARNFSLLLLAGFALSGTNAALRAQALGVQSITTTFSIGGSTATDKLAGANVTFDKDRLSIVTMKDTSGNLYTIDATASTATLRTDGGPVELSQTSAWYMGAAGGGTAATLYGTYNSGNPASLLVGNNLLEGADNVFINSDTGTPLAQGNVERLDFLYNGTAGTTNDGTLAIGVFDRGTGDSFSVAVITGVDASGNPTSYAGFTVVDNTAFTGGSLLTTSSLSSTAASTVLNASSNPTDYLVRYDSSTSMSTANSTSDNSGNTQNVTGVVITLASLGISSGTKIYGYSLMGGDVSYGASINNLTNYSNTTYFPQTTNEAAFDGLDPVAVNGVLFSMHPVPEPSVYAEVFLTAALALWGFRRKLNHRTRPWAPGAVPAFEVHQRGDH